MEEVETKENNTSTPPTEEEESKLHLYKMTGYQICQKWWDVGQLITPSSEVKQWDSKDAVTASYTMQRRNQTFS